MRNFSFLISEFRFLISDLFNDDLVLFLIGSEG